MGLIKRAAGRLGYEGPRAQRARRIGGSRVRSQRKGQAARWARCNLVKLHYSTLDFDRFRVVNNVIYV